MRVKKVLAEDGHRDKRVPKLFRARSLALEIESAFKLKGIEAKDSCGLCPVPE